jgi:hypothetical protein
VLLLEELVEVLVDELVDVFVDDVDPVVLVEMVGPSIFYV